ncbi:MAG: hypothetical protein A3K19_01850 [Lentisphaerae bacterium RIFOXYB12_FULL_65_16]|nr:MAG: hypothetical protein A3K18_02495 [Lentisphaerae bacterium RIFOXYA12_64_32]OGV92729.1 MAG: hypothetical protein A3K19_01850 [Lentisphaerae bacterium RIFOXYB12_FULL_65_16]
MSITIAIIADVHLPDVGGTAQEAALVWALDSLARQPPDLVVFAGDMTAAGTSGSARRFRDIVDRYGRGFRHLITPGNSDRRKPSDWPDVQRCLASAGSANGPGWAVVLLDTSTGQTTEAGRRDVVRSLGSESGGNVVLVTHVPPEQLPAADREWLGAVVKVHPIRLLIGAHHHRDAAGCLHATPVHLVRGLDPDKAVGGPPSVTVFEDGANGWERRDWVFPHGIPQRWSETDRRGFVDLLGFSCMQETLLGLEEARRRQIRVVELRADDAGTRSGAAVAEALAAWRQAGGAHLSIHMPNLRWDRTQHAVQGVEGWRRALDLALVSEASALTIHVPGASVREMRAGGAAREPFAAFLAESLRVVAEKGMTIGFENMHAAPGESLDENRSFGFTPAECLDWVQCMRERLPAAARVGVHLDIGHARNNGLLATDFPLGSWYALVGATVTGYHLHQVVNDGTAVRNHRAFHGLHGPLISLSSFLWAWEAGQLRRAPMCLEIRAPETGWPAYEHLAAQILTR